MPDQTQFDPALTEQNAFTQWLRDLAARIPPNTDGGPSMLNMAKGGLSSAANWLDWKPEIGPDTLAPLGAASIPAIARAPRAMLAGAKEAAPTIANEAGLWSEAAWKHLQLEMRHRRNAGLGEYDIPGALGVLGSGVGLYGATQGSTGLGALGAGSAIVALGALKGHLPLIAEKKQILERVRARELAQEAERQANADGSGGNSALADNSRASIPGAVADQNAQQPQSNEMADFDPNLLAQLLQARDSALPNRPRVGAAPFGLPYLPPLPPRAEMRSANTQMGDRYAQMTDSPAIGRFMSGLDRAGTVARDYAMAGSDKMDEGARHLAEADDPMKVAGGMGEMVHGGVMMMPGVGPAARLFSSVPRAMGTGAAFGLAPMAATGAFSEGGLFSTPAEAATLTKKQERALEETRQRFKLETEAKTDAENKAAETKRQNLAKDAEAAKQLQLKEAQRPWRERNPELAGNWPWIVPLSAAGGALTAKAGEKFAGYMANRPWWQTVRAAQAGIASNDAAKAIPAIAELRQRNATFDPQAKGGSSLPAWVGASLGGELGMLPIQSDILNMGFSKAVENPWELAKAGLTAGMGAMSGYTAGKFGQTVIPGSQPPIEASRALVGKDVRGLITAPNTAPPPQPQAPLSPAPQPAAPATPVAASPQQNLSQLTAPPTQAQPTLGPTMSAAPPNLPSPLSLAPKPIGGTHPDHEWDAKLQRWRYKGRFLSGPPPD